VDLSRPAEGETLDAVRRCWLWLVVLTAGCAVPQKFVASSADYNNDVLHSAVTKLPLNRAVPRMEALAKARGLFLEKKETAKGGGIVLTFTAETEKKWQREERFYRYHNSRYWFLLVPRRDGTTVRALGVPVLEGKESCAPLEQAKFEDCTPVEVGGASALKPLHVSVREKWRLDVSGAMEADMLVAILGDLKRSTESQAGY